MNEANLLLLWDIISNILIIYLAETTLISEYLSKKTRIIYAAVLILSSLIPYVCNGSFIITLAITILVIGIITHRHFINMLLTLVGYIITVTWNYFLLFLLHRLFGLTQEMLFQSVYVVFFNIIMMATTFVLLRLLRCVSRYLPSEDGSVPKIAILFLLGFLAICALIFILNFSFEQSHGYSQEITDANFRLFLIYFTLTAILLVLIALTIHRDAKTKEENSRMKYMAQYTEELEELYWNLRGFKHDYANILYSMKDYMDTNRFDDLKQYYEAEILPGIAALDSNNPAIERLGNIKVPEAKSILYIKIMEAAKKNVRVDLEVKWPIEHIAMSALDLSRLLGILLDNAIEAVLTLPDEMEHSVRVACIRTDIGTVIIIENPTLDTELTLSLLSQPAASTKGKDHGMGLYNADKIIAHYDNAILTTEKTDSVFSQTLEILDAPS